MAIRVSCINKSDRKNPHERIRSIGGLNADRTRWKLSQPQAVEGIQSGKWSFYVERPSGDRVRVVVARSALREPVHQDGGGRRSTQQPARVAGVPVTEQAEATPELGSLTAHRDGRSLAPDCRARPNG